MRPFLYRRATVLVVVLVLVGFGILLYSAFKGSNVQTVPLPPVVENSGKPTQSIIGTSVQGREIKAYRYGHGAKVLAFVGGIHGGYEWNSVVLAYRFMDYLKENPNVISANLSVVVIPSANPDGVFKIIGKEGRFSEDDVPKNINSEAGRFNANGVDLNRNFDCKWQVKSQWRGKEVSAGESAFSEPEAVAIRDFVEKESPVAMVFWHSQSNAVYASQCEKGILSETITLMDAYAKASGYPAVKIFDAYPTTGAADDWLASINIPAITVELKTHKDIEWEKNLLGIQGVFQLY